MPYKVRVFTNSNVATLESQINAFLATLDPAKLSTVIVASQNNSTQIVIVYLT